MAITHVPQDRKCVLTTTSCGRMLPKKRQIRTVRVLLPTYNIIHTLYVYDTYNTKLLQPHASLWKIQTRHALAHWCTNIYNNDTLAAHKSTLHSTSHGMAVPSAADTLITHHATSAVPPTSQRGMAPARVAALGEVSTHTNRQQVQTSSEPIHGGITHQD